MRLHYLQHVPYERIGWIQDWADSRGHQVTGTLLYEPAGAGALPGPDGLDALVIMGGPMNVYEDDEYPFLPAERHFIGTCIAQGKAVLGICLGAQLMALVLGGEVTKATYQEIGWLPVELTEEGRKLEAFADFPDSFTTLQWHGDTFSIPPGATRLALSEAVPNQAFCYDGCRVVGLQFHLEETRETLGELVEVARASAALSAGGSGDATAPPPDPAPASPWVRPLDTMLAPDAPFEACARLLFGLLDRMVAR